ncbi:phosphate starvation-inducible protein PsiF [Iodobacter sp. HSC-16F04]|uniref:Phosphate starvation-inducible protein PsiF n=1 Tax=Iodobacter violaceini TaxID=3044271 RepID=A0ABX0KSX3_9NEIS|nr:PsiF family protein [Iodobacter violacea]NHQ87758.1 phosphate starvation-inducible protein PsiF [Iodobacter violacea]
MLKQSLLGGVMLLAFAATSYAGPQQEKMASCNKDAGAQSLKGDARKAFMSTCLKAAPASAPAMTQQDKMKQCNKDATGKKGDERKAFMSNCLKK